VSSIFFKIVTHVTRFCVARVIKSIKGRWRAFELSRTHAPIRFALARSTHPCFGHVALTPMGAHAKRCGWGSIFITPSPTRAAWASAVTGGWHGRTQMALHSLIQARAISTNSVPTESDLHPAPSTGSDQSVFCRVNELSASGSRQLSSALLRSHASFVWGSLDTRLCALGMCFFQWLAVHPPTLHLTQNCAPALRMATPFAGVAFVGSNKLFMQRCTCLHTAHTVMSLMQFAPRVVLHGGA
jgi:hypothetical protein